MDRIVSVRASSLVELFDCPARWAAKHLEGMRMPRSAAAQLGTAVHAGTAVFDESHLPGGNPLTADEAAGALVDAIHQPEEEVDWDETSPRDVEKIALALHGRYCAEIAPRQTYVGVEVKCERLEIPELGLALTGTTDRVRRDHDGRLGISDLKTGARAVGTDGVAVTAGHGPQLAVYELLAEFSMQESVTAPAEIIGMQTGKTVQRVGKGVVENPRLALVGEEGSPGLLEHASRLIHSGAFYGNPRSYLCSAKYCPRHASCKFKG